MVDRASAAELLRNSYRAVLSTFHANRGLCTLLFEEAVGVEQGLGERLDSHYAVWTQRVADAFEQMKLAILRHKADDWQEIASDEMLAVLDSLKELALAPSVEGTPA